MYYLHTQKVPGKVMTMAALAGLAVGLAPPRLLLRLALLASLGIAAAIFRSLTVEVNDEKVSLSFGDGMIKRTYMLEDIDAALVSRTTPLHGWGIHWTGNSWLYNVYGLDAVELRLKSGKSILIGTDDSVGLAAAINSAKRISEQMA